MNMPKSALSSAQTDFSAPEVEHKMRLNKYIADAGVCSRRKADELITAGNVKVNGAVVRELGTQVESTDTVEVNGNVIHASGKLVYILLNKPVGYVTTSKDEQDRATVLDLITDVNERIFPVGRLDIETSGLLILTNDGDLAYRITHPKHNVTKTYRAVVEGHISNERLAKLRKGVDIGGFVTSRARVDIIRQAPKHTLVEIEIHEGKNRQVRKMFAAVGNKVVELERVAIGNIRLGRMLEGHYRKLTREEVEYLKKL